LVPTTAQLRAGTFAASAVFMAAFFALLSREARAHIKRSEQMTRLAAALSEKNRELEEKTRELATAQESLLASERLAAIGGLAGSVGHELRNPLGVIRNAAYYLRSQLQEPDAEIDEMLDLMDREVETCDRTIAALLDFARPEEATPETIDLNELVRELVNGIEPPEAGCIDLQLDEDLPAAKADRHHLERVFKNIISNAFQAMTNGGTLTVTTGLTEADDTVYVEWSDTGPGISEADLARIFDPLFTTKAKGIGLGLVVCKRLVERQGGRLEVQSEAGKGASFVVHLRRSEVTSDG
jgi:signal transduction histidine kinase